MTLFKFYVDFKKKKEKCIANKSVYRTILYAQDIRGSFQ